MKPSELFTEQEKAFISQVFSQITLKPAQPGSLEAAQMIQSILKKITPDK